MDDKDQTIVEGEVVAPAADKPGADVLLSITQLIQNYIVSSERDQKELSAHRQMLEDAFNNDATYKEHADKAREAAKIKAATKAQIMKQPQLQQLVAKVKELSLSLKESKESLSEYLQEYARITGQRQIEGVDGEINEIVYLAKLIKTHSSRK